MGVPSLPEEAVSPRETLNDCFICRSPLTEIDAKFPENAGGLSVVNLTNSTFTNNFASKKMITVPMWRLRAGIGIGLPTDAIDRVGNRTSGAA